MQELPEEFAAALDLLPDWAKQAVEHIGVAAAEARGVSDRACAIVLASALEDILRKVLVNYLPETEIKLEAVVPPGRLDSLIRHARWLGVISKRLAASLATINSVRNAFGHGVLKQPTFDSPELAGRMGQLRQSIDLKNSGAHLLTGRDRFMTACMSAYIELMLLSGRVQRSEPQFPQLDQELTLDMSDAPTMDEMKAQVREMTSREAKSEDGTGRQGA